MRTLVRFTVAQTVFMNVIFVLMVVLGVYSLFTVPVERYPSVNFGKVAISAFYPGASPSDVEAFVTREIEKSLEDLEDVEYITATSEREYCRLVVKFRDDVDYFKRYDDLRLKVLSIQRELPAEVDAPEFNFIQTQDGFPVVSLNLRGDRDNRALTLMAEELKNKLRQIPGVQEIDIHGEHEREFHISLSPTLLSRFGVTFDQAAQALIEANIAIPAGDMGSSEEEYVILVDEQFRSRDQIEAVVVRRDADGSFVRIRDLIEDAGMSHREPTVIRSVNGADCITIQVIKHDQGNALDILKEVREALTGFEEKFEREGVSIILTQDSTVEIKDAMETLGWSLLIGVILLCALIWWFMGLRNAALTTIGIPFAFLVTMIFLRLTGNSLNEITLFSFVLISGIVVDDAIVVIENIYRHFQEGKSPVEAVIDGTAEVFMPIVAVTLTTVAAFLPMLIMTGSIGEFFAQIPKAVSFALVASVLECLFVLPIHYMDYGPRPKPGSRGGEAEESALMNRLHEWTNRLIHMAIRFRWATLGVVLLASMAAFFVAGVSISGRMPLIRVKLFVDDYKSFFVDMHAPPGSSIEHTSDILKKMSVELNEMGPGMVNSVEAYAGLYLDEDFNPIFGRQVGQLAVTMPAMDDRRFDDYPRNDPMAHIDWVREQLDHWREQGYEINIRPRLDGPPTGKDLNVRAIGGNREQVRELAARVRQFLKNDAQLAPELIGIRDDQGQLNPVFRFQVDENRAGEFGVTPAQVARLTAASLNGRYIGEYRDRGEQVDLKLRIAGLESPEQALPIPLIEHPSGPVTLGDLNRTEITSEPGALSRFQGEPSVTITADLRTGSKLSPAFVVNRLQGFYQGIQDQYPGTTLNFAGEFEDTHRSFRSLIVAFIIAVLIIYLILATQFRSYSQPAIVLSAVPFSLIGVVFGIFFSRSLLTINSMIAMVGVAGIVVNDSLVLIEFINKAYRNGASRGQAIFEGVSVRLRPILLTTLTTSLAFLPMALGIPRKSVVWGSMATTFVTGLCTATFLTLFIIPVQWDLVTQFSEWRQKRATKRQEQLNSNV